MMLTPKEVDLFLGAFEQHLESSIPNKTFPELTNEQILSHAILTLIFHDRDTYMRFLYLAVLKACIKYHTSYPTNTEVVVALREATDSIIENIYSNGFPKTREAVRRMCEATDFHLEPPTDILTKSFKDFLDRHFGGPDQA